MADRKVFRKDWSSKTLVFLSRLSYCALHWEVYIFRVSLSVKPEYFTYPVCLCMYVCIYIYTLGAMLNLIILNFWVQGICWMTSGHSRNRRARIVPDQSLRWCSAMFLYTVVLVEVLRIIVEFGRARLLSISSLLKQRLKTLWDFSLSVTLFSKELVDYIFSGIV